MNTNIYLRKTHLGDAQKEVIVKKVDKLSKFFDDDAVADIVIGKQHEDYIVEVTIRTPDMIYRAEERDGEPYNATDKIIDAIERQIRKNKTRLQKKLREGIIKEAAFEMDDIKEEKEINIVKTKTHHVKPMNAEEAVLQMNMLGHSFFVFLDSETNKTGIVYRRKDGDYGLIETD